MAIVNRNQLKAWFKTFAKPTESQFHDWIDSYRHLSEKINSSDLDAALLQTINNLPDSNAIQQIINELQQKATIQQVLVLQQQINELALVLQPTILTINQDTTFIIPGGKLMHKIVAIAGESDATFSVGYTDLTDELVAPDVVPAGSTAIFTVDHYKLNDYTIFFNGITAQVTIKIYLL